MNNGFLKVTASEEFLKWIAMKRPTAFLLLLLIAKRAKRKLDHPDPDLEMGEAYIGDWKSYCHSERCYRSDKLLLEKLKKVTFRPTNRGTIARIVTSDIIDINEEKVTTKMTDKRRAGDEQVTTNKIYKNNKRERGILPHYSVNYLLEIPSQDITSLKAGLEISESDIRSKAEDLYNYCKAKGRVYKDYRAFLRNALKRDFPRRQEGVINYKSQL